MQVKGQSELDKAVREREPAIELLGCEEFVFRGDYSGQVFLGSDRQRVVLDEYTSPWFHARADATGFLVIKGKSFPRVEVSGNATLQIDVRDSATPRIDIFGAATVRLDCYEWAGPRVEISGRAVLHVRAYNTSHPRIFAHERSSIQMQGRGDVVAGDRVPVNYDGRADVTGGVRVIIPSVETDG